jgi:hypothetical protein
MRLQGGVKSIAIGGRPNTGPIQGIGGVKGANNAGYDYLEYLAQYAYDSGTPAQKQWSNWTSLTDLTLLPVNRSTDTSINLRDNILRANLEEGLPAQFVYEKADCRLFYEPSMVSDVGALWGEFQSCDSSLACTKPIHNSWPTTNIQQKLLLTPPGVLKSALKVGLVDMERELLRR